MADLCFCILIDIYNDATSQYDQTVYINGDAVSTLSTTSGEAQGWGTAVECQAQACDGTALAHSKLIDMSLYLISMQYDL